MKPEDELLQCGLICPICMGVIREAVRDKCGHIYGKECITRWLRKSEMCPMSRAPILKGLVKDYKIRSIVASLELQSQDYAPFLQVELVRGTQKSAAPAKEPTRQRSSTSGTENKENENNGP